MRIPLNWLKQYINTDLSAQDIANRLTMVGHALDKPIYDQDGDTVMDLEDRGNRADAVGIIGIARDLSALLNIPLEYPKEEPIPKANNSDFSPPINVESDKVDRFLAVVFKNVKVEPSPPWLQKRLKSYGLEVFNNIVDITNYIMVETGMPLHAFDLSKLRRITLRPARDGESLTTFDGTNLKLDHNDLITADNGTPLTLTTAVGGQESGINASTTDVLIEAGLYDQPTARRSALKHNVRNETSQRLGKYLHPYCCEIAIGRTITMMKEILKASPQKISFDYYPNLYVPVIATLSQERLNLIAGEKIDLKEAADVLKRLGFTVKSENNLSITVEVPYFRTDVTMEDDLIEEVLRIRGLAKIPSQLPERPAPTPLSFPEMDLENRVKDILVQLGFNEVVSQQIVDIKDIAKTKLLKEDKVVKLENSWNEELNVMRSEYVSPQLKYLSSYLNHNLPGPIRIFEIGKTYTKEAGKGYDKYKETRKIVFSSTDGFNDLKAVLLTVLSQLGIENPSFEKIDFPVFKKELAATIKINGDEIGKIGEVRRSVLESFNISNRDKSLAVNHVVLHTSKLLKYAKSEVFPKVKTAVPNYVSEDFTFIVDEKMEVGQIVDKLSALLGSQDKAQLIGVYSDEKLTKRAKKSVSFNIKLFYSATQEAGKRSNNIKNLKFE